MEVRRVTGVVGADLPGGADWPEQAGAAEVVADDIGDLRPEAGPGERRDRDRDRRGAGAVDRDLGVGALCSGKQRHGGDAGAEQRSAAAENDVVHAGLR